MIVAEVVVDEMVVDEVLFLGEVDAEGYVCTAVVTCTSPTCMARTGYQ